LVLWLIDVLANFCLGRVLIFYIAANWCLGFLVPWLIGLFANFQKNAIHIKLATVGIEPTIFHLPGDCSKPLSYDNCLMISFSIFDF
jgi:hypothetical protein